MDLTRYWITVALGGASSVVCAFLGALLDARITPSQRKAWGYAPAIFAGLAATALPETVPGVSVQVRWIVGLLSVSVWYTAYPLVERAIRRNLEAKLGALSLSPEKETDHEPPA